MDSSDTLYISYGKSPRNSQNEFIINDELEGVSEDRREEILSTLTNIADKQSGSDTLVNTEKLLPYLCFENYASLPGHMILFEELNKHLKTNEYEFIKTRNLNKIELAVVADVATNNNVEFIKTAPQNYRFGIMGIMIILMKTFIDQIFSIVFSKITNLQWRDHELIAFASGPSTNYEPILGESDINAGIITTTRTISWLIRDRGYTYPEVEVRPINTYASIGDFVSQAIICSSIIKQYFRSEWEIEAELNNNIKEEMGIEAPNLIRYSSSIAIEAAFQSIISYPVYNKAMKNECPQKVLVKSDTSEVRFILSEAKKVNSKLYYVPHSVICGTEILPAQKDTIQFIEGRYAFRFLKECPLSTRLPKLSVTGIPKYEKEPLRPEQTEISENDNLRILCATQPFDDRIRKQYVLDIIQAADEINSTSQLIVKLHPSENKDFYTSIIDEESLNYTVKIKKGNIANYIKETDVTITINSNAGIDSIVQGSCTVSYNRWYPYLSIFPYIKIGPVPLLQDRENLKQFLMSLCSDERFELIEKQSRFFKSEFEYTSCANKIAEVIKSN